MMRSWKKRGSLLLAGCAATLMLGGCSSLCGEQKLPEMAPQPPVVAKSSQAAPEISRPQPTPALPTTYTVEKCDDLWSIAAKPMILGEARLWPLLWDANRKLIKNPNKIKEGMVLNIPRDSSEADKAKARRRAAKFPKYHPPAGAKRYCPPK